MAYVLTEELDQIVRQKIASGEYVNEEAVLRTALRTIAAIAEGYEDVQAGRHRSFDEADTEFRRRHNIAQDA